jgi:predicted nucleic acid-binding protein
MAEVLVDTDVLVDHLRTGSGHWLGDFDVLYSVVTRAELFAGHADQEPRVQALLDAMIELPVNRHVAEVGGRIRREHGVAIPDALVAASAILAGASLATRNIRHFDRIDGLRLHDPR